MYSRGVKKNHSGFSIGIKKTKFKQVGNKGVEVAGAKAFFPEGSHNSANGIHNNSNDASMAYEPFKGSGRSNNRSSGKPFAVEKPKPKEKESDEFA